MARRSPSELRLVRAVTKVLVWLYRRTGGAVLLLTSTGRRSGRPWTAPLRYARDGADYVVIASFRGADRHPGWWRNLRAQPAATIQVRREKIAVSASETEGDDRQRLWDKLAAIYPEYDSYAARTTRRIPVIRLTPISTG